MNPLVQYRGITVLSLSGYHARMFPFSFFFPLNSSLFFSDTVAVAVVVVYNIGIIRTLSRDHFDGPKQI